MKSQEIEKVFKKSALPSVAFKDWETFLLSYKEKVGKAFQFSSSHSPLLHLFGQSLFLCRFLHIHPLWADEVLASPFLTQPKTASDFEKDIVSLSRKDLEVFFHELRLFKYKEYLRITLKDLNNAEQTAILSELSELAYAILRAVDQALKTSPPPLGAYHVWALGKLGGREINYSSDVDLIAFSQNPSETIPRHIQNLTRILQEKTEHGFLYRVDWDLRPEGKAGTLVPTMTALENYYETFGANWERQALTKAAPCLGDLPLGQRMIEALAPFMYRKHLDWVSLQEIQSIKGKIDGNTSKKKNIYNVKLGRGGIREIEFFVQAFLLIYGGRDASLRDTSTLGTLQKLKERRYLSQTEASLLKDNYLFLRKLEHRLQLVEENQTHDLPLTDKDHLEVARRMGYAETSDEEATYRFRADLKRVTEKNHEIYNRLFADDAPTTVPARFSKRPIDVPLYHYRDAVREMGLDPAKLEEALDKIRRFKREHTENIAHSEKFKGASRRTILFKLSLLAEAVAQRALGLAVELLKPLYGLPQFKKSEIALADSELVAVGMGKFGGFEIGYGSDLDLIFIYSEDGETSGPKVITNQEYFGRLAQKFIFILSVTTREGTAYAIDTELRPSGKQGLLVTSFASFMEYQKNASQVWEHQALLRAHPMIGPAHFNRFVMENIKTILFSEPFPQSISTEMARLRARVEKELGKESSTTLDFKWGRGGLMDIEFALQYLQLRHASHFPSLQTQNTFEGLDRCIELNLLKLSGEALLMREAYTFYRTLEAKIFWAKGRAQHRFAFEDPLWQTIAADMGFSKGEELLQALKLYKERVREIYARVLGS